MPNRKKVIQGLEYCLTGTKRWPYEPEITKSGCEIYACPYIGNCGDMLFDAIALLKEQEAVEPYMDYDGQDVWRCGKCGNSLMHPSYYESDEDAKNHIRYCSHCGRAVKWE